VCRFLAWANRPVIRKTLFWIHLICGVATGLVILMMSATGVILTYERQMLAWQTRDFHADPPAGARRQGIDFLVASAAIEAPEFVPTSVRFASDPGAPALLAAGRSGSVYVNPYTAEVLGEPPEGLDNFFSAVTGWHRWFNASGDARAPWRAITGASNLAFLFLIVSGIYLWLPRIFRWTMFRAHLLFNRQALRGKARDYNWHHVFGIWTAIPLTVVVATATVFSYPWASNAVYRVFGEEPPTRGARAPDAPGPQANAGPAAAAFGTPTAAPLSLDALFERAATQVEDWKTITVTLPADDAATVSFAIDRGNGGQPQRRHNLTLDAMTGSVASWDPFDSQSPGRQARSWVRFLHTGEALGIVGQTVAGIVSLTSVIMVYTGLALAWRRLVVPLFRRRAA
jgi:uncharacterized iron-regulated membrane protein